MKTKLFLLLMLICQNCLVSGQSPILNPKKTKRQVKSIEVTARRVTVYENKETLVGKTYKEIRDAHYIRDDGYTKFDKNGNVIEKHYYDRNDELIIETYKYDNNNNVVEFKRSHMNGESQIKTTSNYYDDENLLVKKREKFLETNFRYDEKGRLVAQVDISTGGMGPIKYTYKYNEKDLLIESTFQMTGKKEEKTTYEYHNNGKITKKLNHDTIEYKYDSEGHLLEETRYSGHSRRTTVIRYEYDSKENLEIEAETHYGNGIAFDNTISKYLKYDKQCNWTLKTIQGDKNKWIKTIIERKIEYHE